jgi:CheY-like chemotaxis protein
LKRILVVENDEDTAGVFAEFLSESGYEVDVAVDGYDALEKVATGDYAAITMDLKMPRLGGVKATELLRIRRVHTPVIVISGFVPEFVSDLARLKIRHVLHKPIELDALLRTIEQAIVEG